MSHYQHAYSHVIGSYGNDGKEIIVRFQKF
jgi:hypothetical protein